MLDDGRGGNTNSIGHGVRQYVASRATRKMVSGVCQKDFCRFQEVAWRRSCWRADRGAIV
jgi:hypothetical protein